MNPWESWDFNTELDRLNSLIKIIKSNTGSIPDELISLSCERVCISICGSLEQGLKKIFWDYAKYYTENENHWVVYLTKTRLDQLKNPGVSQINKLVKDFDSNFITEGLTDDSVIGDLIKTRNSLAHERGQHSQITISDLLGYLEEYKSLLNRLQRHFILPES
ncbi:MAG: HEPN domain-containing protein [Rhodobacteraceae bacterium]|nr:HEPN domain-containing protein [Paracoccaceae bacterium]